MKQKAIKIGVIGFGSIGARHIENITQAYPQATVCVLTKRTDVLHSHPHVSLHTTKKSFFEQGCTIFFITNETYKHADTLSECLKHNPKGIFIEKPLSHTTRGLQKIVKEVSEKKTVVFVAYCMQFSKPLVQLKKILQQKKIGNVLLMHVSVGQDLRTWRKGDYRKAYSADSKKGGGVVLDLIHDLNYPSWLLDEPIHFVTGVSGKISDLKISCEDFGEGVFVSEKGTVITTHQDYFQIPGGRSCKIVGTKGTLYWDSTNDTIHVVTATSSKTIDVTSDRGEMFRKELAFFMSEVKKQKAYNNLDEAIQDISNAEKIKKHKI